MSGELAVWNLAAYSAQLALTAVCGVLVAAGARLRPPKVLYWFLYVVLCAGLILPALQPWQSRAGTVAGGGVESRVQALGPVSPGAWSISVAEAVLAMLAAGALFRLALLVLGLIRLHIYRKRARPLAAPSEEIAGYARRLGVECRLLVSAEVPGPVTFGLFRPAVLVPERFLELDAACQTAIACHEFLHVRRRDWLFALAEELIRAVFWFHPAVWWLLERIRLVRELVVDRQAVGLTQARKAYLLALLEMADAPVIGSPASAFLRKRHLPERAKAILKEATMSHTRFAVTLAVVTLSTLFGGALAVWSFPLYKPAGNDEKTAKRESRVYKIGEGVAPPRLIHKTEPQYTQEARDAKIQGTVVLNIEVWEDGRAHNMKIQQSLDPGLDDQAIQALGNWLFQPATKDGEPVKVSATVEINFRLS